MKTPDEIEKEIMRDYRPVTMKQAIHNTIWYMRDKKHCTECDHLNDDLDCEKEKCQ
jgi:hypothetical protein